MSYRELRNVVEMMRALGYPRLLSMENFRSPNFKLVAELLEWIVRRFDPNSRVSTILDTEQERVIFIKTVVLILLQKARIKLNPRKLYQADGYAVQELSVVIRVLYDSTKQPLDGDGGAVALNAMRSKVNIKMQEIRTLRQLASQIPQSGATLYDLLSNEVIAAEARSKALSFSLDLPDAEKAIKSAIDAIQNELAQVNRNVQNISSDEATLDATVERKKKEYDQQQKRLAKLQSFRPQYMDEYEKYEKKLKQLYAVYVLKFRNVAYLQQLQTEFDKAERQRNAQAEQAMRNMVERMRADEIAIRSRQLGDLEAEDQNDERSRKKATKVFGNMTGAGLSDDEEDDDEDLENGQISDDDSERFLEDGAKIKEDSLGEAEETTEDKFDVSSGDDF